MKPLSVLLINNCPAYSLKEYVLIEQDFIDIEICRRSEGWVSMHYFLGDNVTLESVGLTLSVAEIYTRVENEDMILFLTQNQSTES